VLFDKMLGYETRTEFVDVAGAPGLWIEGDRFHDVFYLSGSGAEQRAAPTPGRGCTAGMRTVLLAVAALAVACTTAASGNEGLRARVSPVPPPSRRPRGRP
jgi:hypothetical protein